MPGRRHARRRGRPRARGEAGRQRGRAGRAPQATRGEREALGRVQLAQREARRADRRGRARGFDAQRPAGDRFALGGALRLGQGRAGQEGREGADQGRRALGRDAEPADSGRRSHRQHADRREARVDRQLGALRRTGAHGHALLDRAEGRADQPQRRGQRRVRSGRQQRERQRPQEEPQDRADLAARSERARPQSKRRPRPESSAARSIQAF